MGDFSVDKSIDSKWLEMAMDEVAKIPKLGFMGGMVCDDLGGSTSKTL